MDVIEVGGISIAECHDNGCPWNLATDLGVGVAKMIVVMHVLTKHPETYQAATGRDPDEAREEYAPILANPDVQGAI